MTRQDFGTENTLLCKSITTSKDQFTIFTLMELNTLVLNNTYHCLILAGEAVRKRCVIIKLLLHDIIKQNLF